MDKSKRIVYLFAFIVLCLIIYYGYEKEKDNTAANNLFTVANNLYSGENYLKAKDVYSQVVKTHPSSPYAIQAKEILSTYEDRVEKSRQEKAAQREEEQKEKARKEKEEATKKAAKEAEQKKKESTLSIGDSSEKLRKLYGNPITSSKRVFPDKVCEVWEYRNNTFFYIVNGTVVSWETNQ